MPHAIILLAHGSRDPLWRLPVEAVAAEIVRRQPAALVRCAYLEHCTPDFAGASAELAAAGARAITVFPLFLGVGKHAREDIPRLMAGLQASHPAIEVTLMPAAGEYPAMISLMADIALS